MDRRARALPAVSVTGLGVAAIRAAESSREDRLFDDPFAGRFVTAAGWERPAPDPGRDAHLSAWIAVRTRFLDELVVGACATGCRQVVVLGAGLDTRAFRLDWPPGTRLWELDLPAVLEFKAQVARSEGWSPACDRRELAVDLSGDWSGALVGAGFDATVPVVWVAEGLLAYLTHRAGERIISIAAELSVPGSRLGLTVASPERLRAWREAHPGGRAARGDYVALWQSTAPEDPRRWLASLGWEATVHGSAERSSAYGRPLDRVGGEMSGAGLVEATRR